MVSIQITSGGSLDFGPQPMGASGVPPVDGSAVTIYNDGDQAVVLNLLGSDATNAEPPYNTWALSTQAGPDMFAWGLAIQEGGGVTAHFTRGSASFISGLPAGQSATCWPLLFMPTSTSHAGTYAWSGTIIASAGP